MPTYEVPSLKPTLFFLDGTVVAPGRVALAAQYNQYADVEASRVLLMLEDGWVKIDFNEDVIRSLSFAWSTGTLFMLGKSGVVYTVGGRSQTFTRASIKGTRKEHQVVDPEDRGELRRVRCIDERVFACGFGGQFFERRGDVWHNFSLTVPISDSPDFEDITVDVTGHPIVVGSNGAIHRLTASTLQPLDSPTNRYLESVVAGSNGRCFACGNDGVVLSIGDAAVDDLSVELEPARNLWAIAEHVGTLYVCDSTRLLRHDDTDDHTWTVETISTDPVPTYYRLVSAGDELWSFGADHVFVKRGMVWTRLLVPGNEIAP
jgi:hypothetical protein